jgi:hypothetical protein
MRLPNVKKESFARLRIQVEPKASLVDRSIFLKFSEEAPSELLCLQRRTKNRFPFGSFAIITS